MVRRVTARWAVTKPVCRNRSACACSVGYASTPGSCTCRALKTNVSSAATAAGDRTHEEVLAHHAPETVVQSEHLVQQAASDIERAGRPPQDAVRRGAVHIHEDAFGDDECRDRRVEHAARDERLQGLCGVVAQVYRREDVARCLEALASKSCAAPMSARGICAAEYVTH